MTYIDDRTWQKILPKPIARADKKILDLYLVLINGKVFIFFSVMGSFIMGIATILLGFWILFHTFGVF